MAHQPERDGAVAQQRVHLMCHWGYLSACLDAYSGSSLIRNNPPVGTYSSPMPRDLW